MTFSIRLDAMLPHWVVNTFAWVGLLSMVLSAMAFGVGIVQIARHEWTRISLWWNCRAEPRDAEQSIALERDVISQRRRLRRDPLHRSREATVDDLMPRVIEVPR